MTKKYPSNAERQKAYRHRMALDRRNVTAEVMRTEQERIKKLPASVRGISTSTGDIERTLEWLRVHEYGQLDSLTRFIRLRTELRESKRFGKVVGKLLSKG